MEQIDVRILDREYRLSVTPEDKDRLVRAAQMVDTKMRAIRETGKVSSTDRIAVLAALQFAHQILGNGNDAQAQQALGADLAADGLQTVFGDQAIGESLAKRSEEHTSELQSH